MEDLVLVGSGGCMRELYWQIREHNKLSGRWNILGYVDYERNEKAEELCECTYWGNDNDIVERKELLNVVLSVGNPELRRKLANRYKSNFYIQFPSIVLTDKIASDVQIGKGVIISGDCVVSTNVTMNEFSFLNIGANICHDGVIGAYTTIAPRACLAGNVEIGEESYIGINATIRQGIRIGNHVVVGAGAVVVNHIYDSLTVAGVPAKEIK